MMAATRMTDDRRAYPRRTIPMEGLWRGAAGESHFRIADLSWGGCFVETKAEPSIGEETIITLPTERGPVELVANVVAVERGIGFSVRFQLLTHKQWHALHPILGDPAPKI